jgi:hypothetical protein
MQNPRKTFPLSSSASPCFGCARATLRSSLSKRGRRPALVMRIATEKMDRKPDMFVRKMMIKPRIFRVNYPIFKPTWVEWMILQRNVTPEKMIKTMWMWINILINIQFMYQYGDGWYVSTALAEQLDMSIPKKWGQFLSSLALATKNITCRLLYHLLST